ncbi:uncharacterized protein L3040_005601 [Drepanopeziza brunnea f. sp. 'multigermtubi']|uniref:MIT domain-containing protein n=1 Tax=Marssonina brunnea f. sp. multigermtubi (strain MB_m1) TaxID=1072389 RepID=K1WN80_MARBU|nr:MIT domain-containing protein [Drepanopeziza brunnea f. sp. 'multigermtubi' MB_m1]EKD13782.1 MIT domain-containing protein [Drepanopeziza brunnea f. sp. 'multigermtubi' MB_m1]KAJ5041044.1 hypothetical protein L3040_005601 [Drepanopeziza brunnea f. sp. 'multigermtubi']
MDHIADNSLPPFHVEPSTNRFIPPSSLGRSPSFGRTSSRSGEGTGAPFSHNALNSKPMTSADQGGEFNGWSKSSNPSTASHMRKRSNSSARRMSFAGGSSFLDTSSPTHDLQMPFPSKSGSLHPPYDPPPLPIPPMNTLPGLQTSFNNTSSPLTGPHTPSPATRNLDYFGRSWEDSSLGPKDFSHRRTTSTSRSANFGPSVASHSAFSMDGSANRRHFAEEVERPPSRGHSRHRSHSAKGSISSRSPKQPSQKAMLSKALQKANTAVLLDNAQNFDGAMQAYSEACTLLQQVMQRSSGDDDRRKLEAIRNTYTSRITELKKIAPHLEDGDNMLTSRPESRGNRENILHEEEEERANIERATTTIPNDMSHISDPQQPWSTSATKVPRRRDSLLPSGLETLQYRPKNPSDPYGRSYSKSPMRERVAETDIHFAPPMDSIYMPPPLSPRRPSSPMNHGSPSNHQRQPSSDLLTPKFSGMSSAKGHSRAASNESMSWLDTIDESGDSAGSSVHSRTSSLGVRRKRIRAPSGATETEFDTALDEAIEAAYDEGFEPMGPSEQTRQYFGDDDGISSDVLRRAQLAKEKAHQTEREAAIHAAREKERQRLVQKNQDQMDGLHDEYHGNESEDEERMLEEMTRGYVMEDFEFGLQSKSALPRERESDSSGFSGRTWNSSIGSNPTTAGTSLSTVTETSGPLQMPIMQSQTQPSLHPPPLQALPPLPPPDQPPQPPPAVLSSVRSRRLSGQNAKKLIIETTPRNSSPPPPIPSSRLRNNSDVAHPKTAGHPSQRQPVPMSIRPPPSARQVSSSFPGATGPDGIIPPPTPSLNQALTNESDPPQSGSPRGSQLRSELRKKHSSSSLKNMKSRNLSVSNFDDGASERSPNTPLSSNFARDPTGKIPAMPVLPTPIAAAFMEKTNGVQTGGMYLFDSDIHLPESPGSPRSVNPGAPISLEPCPLEYLLRPFWLMRALYQTIAHPRGGYLSTKLFVPRDVWLVKGVKIKSLEDKIANLDFLTAALMKLAKVDTTDADAVLEEMQSLEGVLEQVQATLTKKLGNEVGVQTFGGIFNAGDAEVSNVSSKSSSTSNKPSSFSWRRLRPKNSGIALSNTYASKIITDGPREGLAMATLPMTSTYTAKVRFGKRDVTSIQFSGPNANYMSALARLFDAAQAIDQIARQVEDPGLRHADKTQVGLELCTRHAAEFFGFYICRFVLTDVGLLLDKFIKRGSEWVNL